MTVYRSVFIIFAICDDSNPINEKQIGKQKMEVLEQILIQKNDKLIDQYIKGVCSLLTRIYENKLSDLIQSISSIDDPEKKIYVILITLNREDAFKDFFKGKTLNQDKLEHFYTALSDISEEHLDFKTTEREYIQRCREGWIIS